MNRSASRVLALFAASVVLFAGHGHAEDDGQRRVARVVGDFAEAYLSGDATRLERLWDAEAAGSSAFLRQYRAVVRVRCFEPLGVRIDRLISEGDQATAELSLALVVVDKDDGSRRRPAEKKVVVRLARRGTEWRVASCSPAESELAEALMRTRSDGERLCLMREAAQLVTPELGRMIYQEALAETNRADYEEARQLGRLAGAVAEAAGDRGGEVMARGIASIVERSLNEAGGGVEIARDALRAAQSLGDPDVVARALYNLGRAIEQYEPYSDEPTSLARQVVAFEPRLEDRTLVVRALLLLGVAFDHRSDRRAARVHYQNSLTLAREISDVRGEIAAETGLANLYEDCALTKVHLARALSLGPEGFVATSIRAQLAKCYGLENEVQRSDALFSRALADARKQHVFFMVGGILIAAAEVHDRQGRHTLALREVLEADAVFRELGLGSGGIVARLLVKAGRYDEAIAVAKDEITRVGEMERDTYAVNQTAIAVAYRALGRGGDALAALQKAIDMSEATRPLYSGEDLETVSTFEKFAASYREAIDLLIEQRRPDDALHIAQLLKGRELMNVLKNGRPDVTALLTNDDRATEARLRQRLQKLNRDVLEAQAAGDEPGVARLGPLLEIARAEYEANRFAAYSRSPQLTMGSGLVPVPTPVELKSKLPLGTAFVQYITADRALNILIIERKPDGPISITSHRSEIPLDKLRRTVSRFREKLATHNLAYVGDAQSLYRLLVAPIASRLGGSTAICILPDDVIWQIPFEALMDEKGRHLLEGPPIFYAPSIAAYLALTQNRAAVQDSVVARSLFAVGDPETGTGLRNDMESFYRGIKLARLPDAGREVSTLAGIYGSGSRVYTGALASEAAVKNEAPSYRILHFATHAILDNDSPMFSRIVLSTGDPGEDGLLEAWEVMNMRLRADLVVLSACHTAGGRLGAGEGIVGMTWAFFAAGARSVIASHWNVHSSSASEVMVDFHRATRRQSDELRSIAAALRAAKLALMKRREYRHPFYWAPFVVLGADR